MKYTGEWKLKINEHNAGQFQDNYIEEYITGNWEMKRV
jgi:hypothetical protein